MTSSEPWEFLLWQSCPHAKTAKAVQSWGIPGLGQLEPGGTLKCKNATGGLRSSTWVMLLMIKITIECLVNNCIMPTNGSVVKFHNKCLHQLLYIFFKYWSCFKMPKFTWVISLFKLVVSSSVLLSIVWFSLSVGHSESSIQWGRHKHTETHFQMADLFL